MSLMWKLLATTLLLSSLVNADTTREKIEDYLEHEFGNNPAITNVEVKVVSEKPIKQLKGWGGYVADVHAVLKAKPKETLKQKIILFSNGAIITQNLIDMENGESLIETVKPDFQKKYYRKENLVYGHVGAKHRVAIFSDPMCPFCKDFAPSALTYMKKYPNTFAVYYYHYPILRIHPASATIIRAAVVAERKGVKDVSINMYKMKTDSSEKNVTKILNEFNRVTGANVKEKEIISASVKKQIADDDEVAKSVFVGGTPTIYIDEKIDRTQKLFKTYK